MGVLLFLALVGLLIWALVRNPLDRPEVKAKIYQVNQQWGEFIDGYRQLAENDAERALTERMLRDLQAQGMPVPLPVEQEQIAPPSDSTAIPVAATWTVPMDTVSQQQSVQPVHEVSPRQPMDNTSILLYFGAFLLVAAAGLFVAFGGATGGVRTFIVAVVAALFYCVGFLLWYDKPKLRQAALTFIGIGIVLAPLAGVAAYSYVFRGSGALVWFVTSVVCLGLYAHAVSVLKHPLLEYVLIGTFVSLFESSVAVLQLPAYYYGWGLAAVGLILQAVQLRRKQPLTGTSSASLSANIVLPLAVFVSLTMLPAHGSLQLAIALALAATYYGLLGWQAEGRIRTQALIAAQVLGLTAAAFFGYNIRGRVTDAAIVVTILGILQAVGVAFRPNSQLVRHAATIMLGSLGFAAMIGWNSAVTVLFSLLVLTTVSISVWRWQRRSGCYALGVAAAILAVLIGVYRIWTPLDSGFTAASIIWLIAALQVAALYIVRFSMFDTPAWRQWLRGMILAALTTGLFVVLAGNGVALSVPVQLIVYTVLAAVLMIPLVLYDRPMLWTVLAGLTPAIPLLFLLTQYGTYERPGLLLGVTLGALVGNVALSVWRRTEPTRVFATVLALLTPFSIVTMYPIVAGATNYTGMYVLIMAVLLTARYLTQRRRDVTGSAGISYAAGAAAAAGLALIIAPFAHDRLLAVTTALSIAAAVYITSVFIEKRAVLMALLPVVAQIGLWSAYTNGQLLIYAAAGAGLAALGYYAFLSHPVASAGYYIRQSSLVMSYIALMIYLGAGATGSMVWVLPWAVLLAALTTLHAVWHRQQAVRESVGGFVAVALMMVLHFYGLRNVQVYAHIAAATLAVYAYWRWRRGEHRTSDNYIVATLSTVTVPLALQALAGMAGDLYGWWLLIEQVGIMLLGMILHKRLMIWWGLWVAMAAVLYQLRHLGWAALGVLAVFLIGLAVFRLQRSERS